MGGPATGRLYFMLHNNIHFLEIQMLSIFRRLMKNDKGATAIEYGLIAAGISVAIIAVVNGLGSTLNTKFDSVSTQLH